MSALPITRAEALARLAAFTPRMGRAYAEARNADRGPGRHEAVSRLSAAIRHRRLTEAEVIGAALAAHGPEAAARFIAEVGWRSYWKGLAAAAAGGMGRLSRWAGAGGAGTGHQRRAAQGPCGRLPRRDRHRLLRRLGARTGCHRLSAQPRADVVRLHLDLHPAPALATRGGSVPAPPRGWRCRFQHPFLALGGRAADGGQALPRAGGEHRPLDGGAVRPARRTRRTRPRPCRPNLCPAPAPLPPAEPPPPGAAARCCCTRRMQAWKAWMSAGRRSSRWRQRRGPRRVRLCLSPPSCRRGWRPRWPTPWLRPKSRFGVPGRRLAPAEVAAWARAVGVRRILVPEAPVGWTAEGLARLAEELPPPASPCIRCAGRGMPPAGRLPLAASSPFASGFHSFCRWPHHPRAAG